MARKPQHTPTRDVELIRAAAARRWPEILSSREESFCIFAVHHHGLYLPAIVDAEWAPIVSQFNWCLSGNGYVQRNEKKSIVRLHRLIHASRCLIPGCLVDHRNCDKLDNRSANLRCSNKQQNGWNRGINSNNKSGFKGVCLLKGGKWAAYIKAGNKRKYLGSFDTPEAASQAYQQEAALLHGSFARAEVRYA